MTDYINIRFKYLSTIRDKIGCQGEIVRFSGGANLGDVEAWLKTRYSFSLLDPQIMLTLNGKGWNQYPQKLSTELTEGDLILILPVISGG
ncbi:MAG TPA: MoaD/ThiS family protein [Desulfobacterales bacterium]|nr:MoaD/ThiS family protein [Desulfobacterales bacterium]